MRDERTLSWTQVRAVQPHVALHGDSSELQEGPPVRSGGASGEAGAVEQRSIGIGESRVAAPRPGHDDLGPIAVVEVLERKVPTERLVGLKSSPRTGEHPKIHQVRFVSLWMRHVRTLGPTRCPSGRTGYGARHDATHFHGIDYR